MTKATNAGHVMGQSPRSRKVKTLNNKVTFYYNKNLVAIKVVAKKN